MFRSDYREPPPWMLPINQVRFEFSPGPVGNNWQNIEIEINLFHRLMDILIYQPNLTRAWNRFSTRRGGDKNTDLDFAKWKGGDTACVWSSHGKDHCFDKEFFVTEWEKDSEIFWLLGVAPRMYAAVFSCRLDESDVFDPGVLSALLEEVYRHQWLLPGMRNLWEPDDWIWGRGWDSRTTNRCLTKDFVFTHDETCRGDGKHVYVDEHARGYSPYTGAMFKLWT